MEKSFAHSGQRTDILITLVTSPSCLGLDLTQQPLLCFVFFMNANTDSFEATGKRSSSVGSESRLCHPPAARVCLLPHLCRKGKGQKTCIYEQREHILNNFCAVGKTGYEADVFSTPSFPWNLMSERTIGISCDHGTPHPPPETVSSVLDICV